VADPKVSYTVLEQSEESLQRIAAELEGAEARQHANADIWGSSDVAGAMAEFVSNWDRHRGTLVESLKSVGQMCAGSRRTFAGIDQRLADAGEG
jgi:hypothetical protein